jgi:hypothetical protein
MSSANFIEETTTSIAGTSGNGAVTLTQVTGKPRFSSAYGTAARVVRYVVEDTANHYYEAGIGSVASNVLTRTSPQVTWNGTTYNQASAATPLAFGSAPTAGNILVRIAATAESIGIVMPGRNSTISGDADYRDYPISAHIASANGGGAGQNTTAGTEYYSMYRLENGGALSGFQLPVNGVTGTANVKAALYDIGANGLPKQKIVDFNTFVVTTSGSKTDTAVSTWTPVGPLWLNPGWYAIGIISDNSTLYIQNSGGGSNIVGPSPLGRANVYGYGTTIYVAGNYTTGLPAVPSLGSASMAYPGGSSNLAYPWFGIKVIS